MCDTITMDLTIKNASRSDFDIAEEIANSLLKHPEEWEFYNSDYDSKTKNLDITLYKGELHSDDAW